MSIVSFFIFGLYHLNRFSPNRKLSSLLIQSIDSLRKKAPFIVQIPSYLRLSVQVVFAFFETPFIPS